MEKPGTLLNFVPYCCQPRWKKGLIVCEPQATYNMNTAWNKRNLGSWYVRFVKCSQNPSGQSQAWEHWEQTCKESIASGCKVLVPVWVWDVQFFVVDLLWHVLRVFSALRDVTTPPRVLTIRCADHWFNIKGSKILQISTSTWRNMGSQITQQYIHCFLDRPSKGVKETSFK